MSTDIKTIEKTETEEVLKKPSMYRVMLHNDDFTPREFVVHVLEKFFSKNETQAQQIMLQAHKNGLSLVGVYAFGVAETKVYLANHYCQGQNLPLQFSFEKDN